MMSELHPEVSAASGRVGQRRAARPRQEQLQGEGAGAGGAGAGAGAAVGSCWFCTEQPGIFSDGQQGLRAVT